jgi:predicted amino acid-binding ACT domain protein
VTKFILTVLGEDQPGIISTISEKLSNRNANVGDVQASIMGGYFTMVLFFTCEAENNCKDIDNKMTFEKELLTSLEKSNCKIFLDYIEEEEDLNDPLDPESKLSNDEVSTVTISAKDKPGLLAFFSKYCSSVEISITSLRTVKYGETFFIFAGLDGEFSDQEIEKLVSNGKSLGMNINCNINKV